MSTVIYIVLAFFFGLYYGVRRMARRRSVQARQTGFSTPVKTERTVQSAAAFQPFSGSTEIREKQGQRSVDSASNQEDSEKEDSSRNDYHSDGAFRREFEDSPHCNGFKCNPEVQCNIYERLFCQKIMYKVSPNPGKDWIGQYWVKTPKTWRRVDFAVAIKSPRPPKGEKSEKPRALAIEFDGFKSHANLDFDKFQKQLQRQNDLFMQGWGILRFTFLDLMNRPDECKDMISGAINAANSMSTARLSLPLYFADVSPQKTPGSGAARILKSDIRGKYYIPLLNKGNESAFVHHRIWVSCPSANCTGRAFRNDANWVCDTCHEEFPDKDGLPVKNG